ncbi:Di- and tricarboxylate transporter [Paramagnetospirillum magnetotacticum MS-1]|uniref:Di-and tricarboxylate transporter n=1 Tax=Paramagnetospirillum magnetotacticum MS-1 TaxID=272627 RepID=A0A0C2U9I7_PARME|nr:SLC13 family permease [Paramagnetospirillum magnetotacticum]KIL98147.1 Di- and tricarboxylate transporter [Paramagnetospirillum magnetotacticum MS-1]
MSLSLFRMPLPRALAWAALIIGAAIVVIDPLPGTEGRVLGLAVAFIGLWATAVIPEPMTAVFFFTTAMLLKAAPAGTVFGGFSSAALWLIFGGLIMGIAFRSTGLGERLGARLSHAFGSSYWGVISGVTLVGLALGFLMPSSMGRAIMLMPIAVGLAERYGFAPGTNGRIGVVLAAAFGCHVPTFSILPANLPNLVLVGAAETLWHYTPHYGEYFLLHFPILGFLKTAIMIPLIVWLWPDTPQPEAATRPLGPMKRQEGQLALLLACALVLWATDFLHHVSPAWISMAAGALLLLPGIGLVDRKAFNEQINYGSMFYVAAIMGLGAIVDQSGLGARLAHAVLDVLPLSPGHAATNFASLSVLSTLVSLLTTLPGAPAVLTPMAGQMAEASGMSVEAVLMSQVLGFSNPIMPYQSAPMVVAMQLGGERLGPAQTLCLWLAGITILVLLPLDFLWWRLLGWI